MRRSISLLAPRQRQMLPGLENLPLFRRTATAVHTCTGRPHEGRGIRRCRVAAVRTLCRCFHPPPTDASAAGSSTPAIAFEVDSEDESIAHLLVQASPTTTAPLPPPETEDVAERRRRTKLFLRLVLHSPGEQLWRDVVMSALRLGTLRSHHLEQLLRDVLAPTADPASAEAAAAAVGSGRQLADETGPLPATPTARLHRLVEVIQFVYEQQQELRVEKEQHSADVDPAPKSVATKEAIPPQLVTQRLLIQLLVRLLRSAANHYEALLDLQAPRSPPSVPPSSASPLPCYYTYRGVWSFLAWMERHDLHIGSETVLETLRGAVDLDTAEEQAAHAAAARAPVQLANPPGATSAVHLQRHMNRLAYLDREAVWRKRQQLESGKGGQSLLSRPPPPQPHRAPQSSL